MLSTSFLQVPYHMPASLVWLNIASANAIPLKLCLFNNMCTHLFECKLFLTKSYSIRTRCISSNKAKYMQTWKIAGGIWTFNGLLVLKKHSHIRYWLRRESWDASCDIVLSMCPSVRKCEIWVKPENELQLDSLLSHVQYFPSIAEFIVLCWDILKAMSQTIPTLLN